MATYEVTDGQTIFSDGSFATAVPGSLTLDDGDAGDDTFTLNEVVTGTRVFIGTVEIDGVDYPVIMSNTGGDPNDGVLTVMNIQLDSTEYPTVASLGPIDPSPFLTCFLAGTLIATPTGERAVEKLVVGDSLLDHEGRTLIVRWIGRQTVATRFGPAERLSPVLIRAGALGPGRPHSDLRVTSEHALLISGVLCNAGALINGITITRVPLAELGETFTVYHVETEGHDILRANGAAAESFIDNVSRRVFDNYPEFEALYGDPPEMEESGHPRAVTGRQVPAAIRRLLDMPKSA